MGVYDRLAFIILILALRAFYEERISNDPAFQLRSLLRAKVTLIFVYLTEIILSVIQLEKLSIIIQIFFHSVVIILV